jgi:hypothetical protein
MNWVTWENVGVDRIGCAWLIQRCIDQQARFHFVPEGEAINANLGQAFDIPGARFSHRQGHASFQTLLEEYDINDPVMHRIARIINEADTVQEMTLEPLAAGLDAISRGLRLSSHSDTEAIERGRILFEALYAVIAADIQERTTK